MSDRSERRIALAAVAGAHGVKGEIRLKLFCEDAASLAVHRSLYVGGARRRLLAIRDGGKTAVARFEGVTERSSAESLRGQLVEIDRSELPPLEDGEYYHTDLIGLPALDREGNLLGTVSGVEDYGAGDLLEIAFESGRRALIPFKLGIAQEEAGRIILDPNFLA